jgi:hypothetical protein
MTKTQVQNMECQIPKEQSEGSRKNQYRPYPTAITSNSNHGTAPPTIATVADTEDARKHASAGSIIHAKAGMIQWSDMTKALAQNMKDQAQESNRMCSAKTSHQLPTMWQRSYQQPHRGTGHPHKMQTRTEGTRKCVSTEHTAFEKSERCEDMTSDLVHA